MVFQTKGDKVKFDFDKAFVDQVLSVMQEAPVPFKIVNPMLQEFIRQINDERIQSLEYPVATKADAEAVRPEPGSLVYVDDVTKLPLVKP